ncbi:8-amino-7-oxononanoate synthase [Anaeromyxobacter diazotrophicus]|uniref:8-amino-7-oxononanoate synthase n=1 Tax=Anaeromyxobacter diazotrophicus TaxID=2590199 RepID=A0A7I9VSP7_9BACT|nr:8-amino-7-oxononanoate synthase [Anaeromyxobacter diazotrophicus]GEJ59109.1 8-amino-7-oxononanoate synthase [Anaeromyxobacter diazotrophicus]
MPGALSWLDGALAGLSAKGLRRALEPLDGAQGPVVSVGGRALVNLCSNDYLGLAADPRLVAAAVAAAQREGAGAGAARLVAGDLPVHGQLERRLASFKHAEAALLFSSGYHANAGIPAALADREDAIFSDRLNHASLIDGCRLSLAKTHRYPHGDVDALARLLRGTPARRKLVVTDAVFGMDGDAAPLAAIAGLCRDEGAMLYVDEAHATGVLGPTGAGWAEAEGIRPDVLMGTLGKALGSFGAFAAGSANLCEWLTSRARTFIFTTALPPAACGAALAALDVLAAEPDRRARVARLAARMKEGLAALGFDVSRVVAPIFPVVLGEEAVALEASRRMRERGFLVRAIRPPTVPAGTSRLRVSLTAGHTEAQVDAFLAALREVVAGLRRC